MIHAPQTEDDHKWCRKVFEAHQIRLGTDAHILAWVRGDQPTWLIGFDLWLGTTCQIHMVGMQPFLPKAVRWATFNYAFNMIGRTHVFAVVNSKNPRSWRIVEFVGFREVHRVAKAHENGGDLILYQMDAADWRAKNG